MSYVSIKKHENFYVDLESHGVTVNTLQNIFDIEEVSAKDLFMGVIPFKKREIKKIAQYIGVSVDMLIKR